jgi:hypothetical protein
MAAKMKYLELSNAQIADKRRLVISECVKENQDTKENIQCGFTLAQQVEVEEGKRMTRVFLKNGIHVASIDELYNLRDAINDAINKYEEKKNDEEEWEN